jgi:cell division protein ZapA (FtsZ GTPase activity inhibitor)
MSGTSIRIELAGRAYPLSVSPEEEVNIRKAAQEINESITRLKAAYPLIDKQDLLAMAALEVTTRVLNQAAPRAHADDMAAVEALEELLSTVPERSPS